MVRVYWLKYKWQLTCTRKRDVKYILYKKKKTEQKPTRKI